MSTIYETGFTWQEKIFGVFDPADGRLVETFGADGYTDYDGEVYPIIRTYTVTGVRYNRFGDKVNTVEHTEAVLLPSGDGVIETSANGGSYLVTR